MKRLLLVLLLLPISMLYSGVKYEVSNRYLEVDGVSYEKVKRVYIFNDPLTVCNFSISKLKLVAECADEMDMTYTEKGKVKTKSYKKDKMPKVKLLKKVKIVKVKDSE